MFDFNHDILKTQRYEEICRLNQCSRDSSCSMAPTRNGRGRISRRFHIYSLAGSNISILTQIQCEDQDVTIECLPVCV
ncbi:hypothetical protein Y032_1038g3466 [Ancylostoma ceylanicum]|uniref:Uncharacterized protein n=1 Tax=Ancylostoma ceylanicum TaxID=53326 RepID=A0A016W934_9BILA|nr:hypothetical protein Y032_1038g3466 [Ancylostoma ceylanicum]